MKSCGFLVVWEFHVKSGQEARFEHVYGPEGDWARFFSVDPAYLGTELLRSAKDPRAYLTLDFWKSEAAYLAFRERRAVEYERIDSKCAELTEAEREIGWYVGAHREL